MPVWILNGHVVPSVARKPRNSARPGCDMITRSEMRPRTPEELDVEQSSMDVNCRAALYISDRAKFLYVLEPLAAS